MAKQFSKKATRSQLNLALSQAELDESMTVQPDTVQIVSWLSRLHLLYGIPFNYLVPDIRMLPDESIRFFQVDENWITALIDGAFSPGTTIATSLVTDALKPQVQVYVNENLSSVRAAMLGAEQEEAAPAAVSGFFLRSAAVSGWPGMEVTGYSDAAGEQPLGILRMERISPSLLLCLFNGIVARVEIREPAETLRCGFNPTNWGSSVDMDTYSRPLRYVNTEGNVVAGSSTSGWAEAAVLPNRVVKIHNFADNVSHLVWAPNTPQAEQVFTSAEFALNIVQDYDVVTFQINS